MAAVRAGVRWRTFPLLAGLLAVLFVLGSMPAYAIDPTRLQDPKLEARYLVLIHEFRCPVCQNETLADSGEDVAGEVRAQIRKMLLEGKSDDQIRQYLVSRYTEFILFKPQYSLRNAWLWLLPFALLAIGIITAARIIRGRAALVDQDAGDADDELAELAPRASATPPGSGASAESGPAREGAAR
jgi:cytochrome c-type biogenesis protein CcmH